MQKATGKRRKLLTMEERINALENRMTKVETKVDDVKEDIKDIKDFQKQTIFWLIGTMTSTLITLGVLLFKG
jgi:archaellum component FlaC